MAKLSKHLQIKKDILDFQTEFFSLKMAIRSITCQEIAARKLPYERQLLYKATHQTLVKKLDQLFWRLDYFREALTPDEYTDLISSTLDYYDRLERLSNQHTMQAFMEHESKVSICK